MAPTKPPASGRSPPNAEALFAAAMAAYENGDLLAARKKSRRLQQILPGEPAVWQVSAAIAMAQGKPAIAADHCRKGLARSGGSPALHDLFGTALAECGRWPEAEAAYRKSLDLEPGNPGALNNLGNALLALQRFDEAAEVYRKSLGRRPAHVATLGSLGRALEMTGDLAAAEAVYRQALELSPDNGELWWGLAGVLARTRRLEDSLECYWKATEIDPDNGEALNGLAGLLLNFGRLDEAREALSAALALRPDDPKVKINQSVLNFYCGDWEQAWRAYESRWGIPGFSKRPFGQPEWAGESLKGKTILVWQEQGLGDEIMFASMIPDLMSAGADVILECDARIKPLFAQSFPGLQCVARSDPPCRRIAEHKPDYQIPAGNLGRWFRKRKSDFPSGREFLHADAERVRDLRNRYLAGDPVALIGVSWRSTNPDQGPSKSMGLADLSPALRVPGACFLDLQYGDTAQERHQCRNAGGVNIIHDSSIDAMVDFDDHAAQVAACDLVISISTTTAHLAGSLGVPAWVMLEVFPDRRWLLGWTDSPWYRSVSLIRQSERGDWRPVVAEVAEELPKFIQTVVSR